MNAGSEHIKNHPRRAELVEKGKCCLFFGIPTTDMSQEDLLMMIGYLGEDKIREEGFRRKERELLSAFDKAR